MGEAVGKKLGNVVGKADGTAVGTRVGDCVGERVGENVGDHVGPVGFVVGTPVGASVGDNVGETVGDRVGAPTPVLYEMTSTPASPSFKLMVTGSSSTGEKSSFPPDKIDENLSSIPSDAVVMIAHTATKIKNNFATIMVAPQSFGIIFPFCFFVFVFRFLFAMIPLRV